MGSVSGVGPSPKAKLTTDDGNCHYRRDFSDEVPRWNACEQWLDKPLLDIMDELPGRSRARRAGCGGRSSREAMTRRLSVLPDDGRNGTAFFWHLVRHSRDDELHSTFITRRRKSGTQNGGNGRKPSRLYDAKQPSASVWRDRQHTRKMAQMRLVPQLSPEDDAQVDGDLECLGGLCRCPK